MSKHLPPHSRPVANTYAHMGLTRARAPEAYRALIEAETEDEAAQVVVDWLRETRKTEEYAGARERADNSAPEMPLKMKEELAQLRREAEESGDSRLVDWLLASEPLLVE